MSKTKKHLITAIEPNSIAEELEISAGDYLVAIDGKEIKDIFDYRFLTNSDYFELLIETNDGEVLFEIEMNEGEELGLEFDTPLMDCGKNCANKCIFCFIDQLPEKLRSTLYFKDDDVRLSFLTGNYVTLTNIGDSELDRLIGYHLSPINISVHASDPEIRAMMLGNKKAGKIFNQLDKIASSGIEMNFQIVLCKGINDGEILERTISDLRRFLPSAKSLSVVPVGLSKFRDACFKLEAFNADDARKIILSITRWQQHFIENFGTAFVYASDEFYLKAGIKTPVYEEYEDFPQIENGVGMLAQFQNEFDLALTELQTLKTSQAITVVTGKIAEGFITDCSNKIMAKFPNIKIRIAAIENCFFGEKITVAGLLTGCDIISQLKNMELGETLFIPKSALKSDEELFLDDVSVSDLRNELSIDVRVIPCSGFAFIDAFRKE